jgi:hypothetical protein
MSESGGFDGSDDAGDVVDAEIVDDGPGTELDVWDPDQAGDAEPGTGLDPYTYGLDPAQPAVTVLGVEDPEDVIDAEIAADIERGLFGHPQVTGDAPAASRGGSSSPVDRPGGKGIGGGKISRKERRGRGGGGGGGFTLFGLTFNVSPRLNIASGNTASVFGGRAERKAKAARLARGGKHGSAGAMNRRMIRSRWLDRALGGKR